MMSLSALLFFLNDTATTEIYPLSLHDALPICAFEPCHEPIVVGRHGCRAVRHQRQPARYRGHLGAAQRCDVGLGFGIDRKSTRLNSSHSSISYAVFCLKKKKSNPPLPVVPSRD